MLKPIPMKLLIHSATYEEFVDDGRYGESFRDPITFNHIRIDYATSVNASGNTESKSIKALMFFDLVNSKASGMFEFKEKSKITFNGMVLHVQKVNPLYSTRLHHYEVELI